MQCFGWTALKAGGKRILIDNFKASAFRLLPGTSRDTDHSMNIIILRQEELTEEGSAFLSDRRAKHIVTVLKGALGKSVKVGILDGPAGTGIIERIKPEYDQP